MIKLPDKSKCKRKHFKRALIPGNFIYMEFMYPKTRKSAWGCVDNCRDLTPKGKIYKVLDKTRVQLVYLFNKGGDLIKPNEGGWDEVSNDNWSPKLNVFVEAHNIWSWFQKDEIRNIRSMDIDELAEEFLMEML